MEYLPTTTGKDAAWLKQQAAEKALEFVHSGMAIGLGTGSTTYYFVELLGQRLQSGELSDLRAVPTSQTTARQAQSLGIPLTTLQDCPELDLAVDGADEVDPRLNLIKGLGRALLREKIVEIHARQFLVLVDESKLVKALGRGPLPVEIVSFEAQAQVRWLNSLGCRAELWLEEDGAPVVTDNHNYLARCWFSNTIPDPYALADQLAHRPGIVEHGLFLDMAHQVIVARPGGVELLERSR
jgi:ribose 5-phosphate isomerase A